MSASTLWRPGEISLPLAPRVRAPKDAPLRGVTIISTYSLAPTNISRWLAIWRELGRLALERPECRDFRLLRDRNDPARYSVLSEWDDSAAYHAFVRGVALLWLERGMPGMVLTPEFTVLERAPGNDWEEG